MWSLYNHYIESVYNQFDTIVNLIQYINEYAKRKSTI